jgi:hypothetical protein
MERAATEFKKLDAVAEATAVVGACLEMIEARAEVQQLLTERGSRFMCRCPSCRSSLRRTLEWLTGMRAVVPAPEAPASEPVPATVVHSA